MVKVKLAQDLDDVEGATLVAMSRVPNVGEYVQRFTKTFEVIAVLHIADPPDSSTGYDAIVKVKRATS